MSEIQVNIREALTDHECEQADDCPITRLFRFLDSHGWKANDTDSALAILRANDAPVSLIEMVTDFKDVAIYTKLLTTPGSDTVQRAYVEVVKFGMWADTHGFQLVGKDGTPWVWPTLVQTYVEQARAREANTSKKLDDLLERFREELRNAFGGMPPR